MPARAGFYTSEDSVAESKTEEVNVSQTLAQAIAELDADELASDQFILVVGVGDQISFVQNGTHRNLREMAADTVTFVAATHGDEVAAESLKQAGRLN